MCFDFCQLGATIDCSQVTRDGYEASNLVSNIPQKRQQGLLCESFVKPPVEIVVCLKCPIQLHYVCLRNKVGAQQSAGFELYSQIASQTDYCLLGKAYINEVSKEDRVYLTNRNFHHRDTCRCVLPKGNENSTCVRYVSHHLSQATSNAERIKIRIVKTSDSSIPALSRIEIWGQPARSVSGHALIKINEMTAKLQANAESFYLSKKAVVGRPKPVVGKVPSRAMMDLGDRVPNEFVDPITNEIMGTPMLMPSGNSVDQSTLDKYCANEASWGRPPNDPFTGLLFAQGRVVVPNTSLKTRIDSFLLTRPDLGKGIGRSVGESFSRRNRLVASRMSNYSEPVASSILGFASLSANPSSGSNCDETPSLKQNKRFKVDNDERAFQKNGSVFSNHEENLRDSLHLSLQSVMKSITSYTKKQTVTSADETACTGCSERKIEYQLPCSHRLCRTCLTDATLKPKPSCHKCRIEFQRQDPVKIYI